MLTDTTSQVHVNLMQCCCLNLSASANCRESHVFETPFHVMVRFQVLVLCVHGRGDACLVASTTWNAADHASRLFQDVGKPVLSISQCQDDPFAT